MYFPQKKEKMKTSSAMIYTRSSSHSVGHAAMQCRVDTIGLHPPIYQLKNYFCSSKLISDEEFGLSGYKAV
jgi:hypothetical protein